MEHTLPPSNDANGIKRSPPTETPFILFCTIHKDAKGNPLPYSVLGERSIYDDDGNYIKDEPIYECMKCVFP